MVNEYLLDTNIWIDFLGGVQEARDVIENLDNIAMCGVTYVEVASGCDATELAMFESFLQADPSIQIIHTDDQIVKLASTYNKNQATGKSYGRKRLADSIIGATAALTRRVLVTRNSPDFKMVSVVTPYQGQWIESEKPDGSKIKTWVPTLPAAGSPPATSFTGA